MGTLLPRAYLTTCPQLARFDRSRQRSDTSGVGGKADMREVTAKPTQMTQSGRDYFTPTTIDSRSSQARRADHGSLLHPQR